LFSDQHHPGSRCDNELREILEPARQVRSNVNIVSSRPQADLRCLWHFY